MLNSSEFRTRSLYMHYDNPMQVEGKWPVAFDIGYSGVKGMSPNSVSCFPSYARELEGQMLGDGAEDDILYQDDELGTWLVGNAALAALKGSDSGDSMEMLYGRHRYFSKMFKVLARVALAIGLRGNDIRQVGKAEVHVQTGLPSSYLHGDTQFIKEVVSGRHKFSIMFGRDGWLQYDITVPEEHVDVMDQAMGAVFSATKYDDGTTRLEDNGKSLVEGKIFVADGGFGTFNTFSVFARQIEGSHSFDDLGMKKVLSLLSERLKGFGVDRMVHTLQPILETGYVKIFDRGLNSTRTIDISEILQECSDTVMGKALERLDTSYNYLQEYDHLLLSGGTCAAWMDGFQQHFANRELNIVVGDRNHNLGPIFNVVRGYYIFQSLLLQAGA